MFQKNNISVVSLFISGRPLIVDNEIKYSDSFVSIWLPGTAVEGINDVNLELVWDPPWTKDMMSDAAKLELNL